MFGLMAAGCSPEPVPPADGPAFHMDFSRASLFDAPVPSADLEPADLDAWPGIDTIPYTGWVRDVAARRPGAPRTAGVLLAADALPEVEGLDVWATLEADSPVWLVALDGPRAGERAPVDVHAFADPGPYGTANLLSVVPLQGWPLAADTTWALAVSTRLTAGGEPFRPSPVVAALRAGHPVPGLAGEALAAYAAAARAVPGELAALAVFETGDPAAELLAVVEAARSEDLAAPEGWVLTDVFPTYCVWEATLDWPVYQGGDPPFSVDGGAWVFDAAGVPVVQRRETGRVWLSVPRGPAPTGGWPVATMIRTGGGGDRPLVDRGPHPAAGAGAAPGTGPAEVFAAAGLAGASFDGVLGGLRNPTGADEQFLVFNFQNPEALRDNVRQSAIEVALFAERLPSSPDLPGGCDDAEPRLDLSRGALFGHSMGATIAPLALAAQPRYDAVVLSGAGGSYAANVLYKQLPLEVRPIAEAILGYAASGRALTEGDPFLTLLQWAAEDADPPVYVDRIGASSVLMIQGIVDHYILPPIANTTSLAFGLDLAGDALDATEPELAAMRPLGPLLPLAGARAVTLPAGPAVVVQVAADGIEDGHEVAYQVGAARRAYRCFLASWVAGAAVVPAPADEGVPCP